jgi:hypothetical protein
MLELFGSFNGRPIWAQPMMSMQGSKVSEPDGSFDAMVHQIHRQHPVISAAVAKRAALLSQLRFKWRSVVQGDNGRLWGDQSLMPLEMPNESQTRSGLLQTAEHHVSYGGTAFFHRVGDTVRLLNPGRTSIALGSNLSPDDPGLAMDARVVGYLYTENPARPTDFTFIPPDEVSAWTPEPDPISWWRGSSWVQAVISDYVIDRAAHLHITKFFENAATPQMVFSFDATQTVEQLQAFAEIANNDHSGAANAYKNLFLGGGADAKVVGADLSQLDLRNVTGLTETRIAVRSQVPAVVLGISEGLAGSSLNAGNYSQARRLWGDAWFTPTALGLCAALERIVPPPDTANELSFDPTQVMFLQDDRLDEANVRAQQALTMRQLIDAGFEPTSVVNAVNSGDYSTLSHTGLFSVQLQPPGTEVEDSPDDTTEDDAEDPPARTLELHVHQGDTIVERSTLTVDARQEPAVVNVAAAEVHVPPTVVNLPKTVVNVPEPSVVIDRGTTVKTIERDDAGNISRIAETRTPE